jgi:hypothetical protein
MLEFELYPLKDLMEDFYISELSKVFEISESKISYNNSQDITIEGKSYETLLSERQTSKKIIFRNSENRVLNFLKTFKCKVNEDVQNFLHDKNKCLRFQKKSKTRTYFIIDKRNDEIAAYFSISYKPIILEKDHKISKSKCKKMSKEKNNKNIDLISTILIGQIGKSDGYSSEDIDLENILEYVFYIINIIKEYIGGRVILIEVDNEPKLIKHYEKYGFEKLQTSNDLSQLMQLLEHY